jgi:hypothetical protein
VALAAPAPRTAPRGIAQLQELFLETAAPIPPPSNPPRVVLAGEQ